MLWLARRTRAVLVISVLARRPSPAQTPASACALAERPGIADQVIEEQWRDPSPHRERRLTIQRGLTLSVLDWGGAHDGVTILWIPGANSTAHVFDDLAPRFAPAGRQLGLTPRGQAPSSIVDSGYSISDRLQDVLAVLDSFHVARAVLVGHSLAGDLLTAMALRFPSRVAGLVYLDAAYDRSSSPPLPPFGLARIVSADLRTLGGLLRTRCGRTPMPSSAEVTETLLSFRNRLDVRSPAFARATAQHSRIADELAHGAIGMWPGGDRVAPPQFPVAFVYALHANRDDALDIMGIRDDTAAQRRYRAWWDTARQPLLDFQRRSAIRSWPKARLTLLSEASHMVMWTDPDAVVHAIRSVINDSHGNP
jgi:pimeloyl-ACP methyl ester carboxylesterase